MSNVTRNRLGNCHNRFQGDSVRVLCVCSAGLLRSPTMARVLTRDFDNVNPRAVGSTADFALIPIDQVHLEWADLILCADVLVADVVEGLLADFDLDKPIVDMSIQDDFGFADPILEDKIRNKLALITKPGREFQFVEPKVD
jgi:predicted protein tyrosine phosphatase